MAPINYLNSRCDYKYIPRAPGTALLYACFPRYLLPSALVVAPSLYRLLPVVSFIYLLLMRTYRLRFHRDHTYYRTLGNL